MRLNAFRRPASYRLSRASLARIVEGAHPKAIFFETWNAAKSPLIDHQTVDKYAFESTKRLPLTSKLGTKSLKLSRVFISNYNLFCA